MDFLVEFSEIFILFYNKCIFLIVGLNENETSFNLINNDNLNKIFCRKW